VTNCNACSNVTLTRPCAYCGRTPDTPLPDKGAHYRHEFQGVKLDPYRIAAVYGLSGPAEHAVKKLLRGTDKGHTEIEVIQELRCILDRWEEMLNEETT